MTDKERVILVKKYFDQIRKTDCLIQRLTDTVAGLRSRLTSQDYNLKLDKVQTSSPNSIIEKTLVKIIDLENNINARIDELVSIKQEAFDMIKRIHDLNQQNVLVGRYIQQLDWEIIAEELNYSTQWVYEIHGRGLIAFFRANQDFFRKTE